MAGIASFSGVPGRGIGSMPAELDSLRPVHPSWPGRRVPEEGDERKRQRPPSGEDGRHDQDGEGDGGDRDGMPGDKGITDHDGGDPRQRPPGDDRTGQHVDEYV